MSYNKSAGFEILAPDNIFIPWTISQKDFCNKHQEFFEFTDSNTATFLFPIRIGNLTYEKAYINDLIKNSHKPIYSISIEYSVTNTKLRITKLTEKILSLGGELERSYYIDNEHKYVISQLKTEGYEIPSSPTLEYASETLDILNCIIKWNNIKLNISRGIRRIEDDIVHIDFINQDNVYKFFKNEYYKHIEISQQIIYDEEKLSVDEWKYFDATDYHEGLDFKNKVIIWRDDINNCIGFVDKNQIQIYNLNEILFFSLTNVDDGRIGFYSHIEVHLATHSKMKSTSVLSYSADPGYVDFFDDKLEILEEIFQKEVRHEGYLS